MSAHHGHDDGPLDPPHLVEVANNVYAYIQPDGTWWINNTGFIVANDGVTAIDTCSTERRTKAFLDTVAGVTDAPIRVVINTHHHGDHTHGNYLTHPATIIGHVRCRDLVIASGKPDFGNIWDGPEWGDIEIAPPFVTFDDHLTVWTGDVCAELHYIGTPAHTTNDIVAYLPEQKVLYTGDLIFNGGTPFMLMGSVAGSLKAVERLRQFDADVIVPGHGPICDLDALDQHVRYYEFVLATAADARASGVSPLEAGRSVDLGEFTDLLDAERIVGNLHRAMHELDGNEPGSTMNIVAAIGDMIAYNGGQPLRCLA